ncbi:MAG: Uma2 family endonuclease [Myxococcota bacterium]
MSTPGRSLATYEDLVRLPPDVRAELLAGEVITAPAPLPRHSKAQRALGSFIGRPYDDDDGHGGPGGWWIFVEVDVALGPHDVVRPDLSGWRRERLHAPGDRRPIEVAPDWVCEVLSPSTAAVDRGLKRDLYYRHEVGHYWLVDPLLRQVEVLARRPEGWLLLGTYGSEATVALPPFTDVTVPLGRLFLPPPDPDAST